MGDTDGSTAPVQWGVCHHRQKMVRTDSATGVQKAFSRLEVTQLALAGYVGIFPIKQKWEDLVFPVGCLTA